MRANSPAGQVRSAAAEDIPFLVDAIIAAEKSGTDKLSYSTIFGIPETEVRQLLAEMLAEDVPGQELCVSGFLIAEREGEATGAVCGWIEGAGAKSSAIIKGSLLMHFLGRQRVSAAAANLKLMETLVLPRASGALQLESIFVTAAHRGQGVCAQLLAAHQERVMREQPGTRKTQIILAKSNDAARLAYEKAGFAVTDERCSSDPRVLELLPAATRVLMERHLQ